MNQQWKNLWGCRKCDNWIIQQTNCLNTDGPHPSPPSSELSPMNYNGGNRSSIGTTENNQGGTPHPFTAVKRICLWDSLSSCTRHWVPLNCIAVMRAVFPARSKKMAFPWVRMTSCSSCLLWLSFLRIVYSWCVRHWSQWWECYWWHQWDV